MCVICRSSIRNALERTLGAAAATAYMRAGGRRLRTRLLLLEVRAVTVGKAVTQKQQSKAKHTKTTY